MVTSVEEKYVQQTRRACQGRLAKEVGFEG